MAAATSQPRSAPDWSGCCERARTAAVGARPGLTLDPALWRREVTARVDDRLRAAGLTVGDEQRARWLERAAQADLALAVACGERAPGAWESLVDEHRPRLIGFARSRGADAAEAERLTTDVLGDLLLPGSEEDARPLLATYAGGGSLFGFLAVLLARKQARRARDPRERRRVSAAASAGDDGARTAPEPAAGGADPAAAAETSEQARCLADALRAAANGLTSGEALALALKHRDGASQRRIAAVLGVGEPRVSRILASAVARLRAAIAQRCPSLLDAAPEGRAALRDVLARHLAVWGPATAPAAAAPAPREGG